MAERARQFMPFASLRGYYDLIREKNRTPEPRHVLSEEEEVLLSQKMNALKRGMMISVTWYTQGAYTTTQGLVSMKDTVGRTLRVVKTDIPFDSIRSISSDALPDIDYETLT